MKRLKIRPLKNWGRGSGLMVESHIGRVGINFGVKAKFGVKKLLIPLGKGGGKRGRVGAEDS